MLEAFIPGLNNRYIIYEDGHILDSLTGSTVKTLHASRLPGRYPTVSLETTEPIKGRIKPAYKHKQYKVHRLMAEAFIPNPLNKKTVNHIDGNTQNNTLSNLEWATHSENAQHAYTHSKTGRAKKPSCVTEQTKSIVLCALAEYNGCEVSVADISDATELPYSAVRYSLVRLIEEGRIVRNRLSNTDSKYARYSYTVLDNSIEPYQQIMPGFVCSAQP